MGKTTRGVYGANTDRPDNDFYETNPKAVELLLQAEQFSENIWECACGRGAISKVLIDHGYNVCSTDLVDRGYGETGIDFLEAPGWFDGDIITNPPYSLAEEFVVQANNILPQFSKAAFFLRLSFLESKKRKPFFEKYPPKRVYVITGRIGCAKNGDWSKANSRSAVAYAWFVWKVGFKGEPVIRWL